MFWCYLILPVSMTASSKKRQCENDVANPASKCVRFAADSSPEIKDETREEPLLVLTQIYEIPKYQTNFTFIKPEEPSSDDLTDSDAEDSLICKECVCSADSDDNCVAVEEKQVFNTDQREFLTVVVEYNAARTMYYIRSSKLLEKMGDKKRKGELNDSEREQVQNLLFESRILLLEYHKLLDLEDRLKLKGYISNRDKFLISGIINTVLKLLK
ncbi:hypothetical protein ECANGB1_1665 [Enterospora canceri]|uniref:Uncharacterized protein n=1 Tax=Enterospora canceri TaxID=1081671 RepID=A0A1Y1S9Y9_9MICR|nr:hypothetical protein ECANGB1_1665 [Enterospora canceri]